ncbi:MAG TPA: carboxypeptidase regulatory-like domain-containing protein, partial [Longimicrobiaceae bacterium]|nr:carboxypeptidase regulatory-like domain-containing protein [Longimicrobiaceae bacterium]
GAHMVLRDEAGRAAASANTDASGRFLVRAGAPGRYVLRGERIGFTATLSEPMELGAGQTVEYRMVASASPVGLLGFLVSARARCVVRAGTGPQTAVVWEEARKALQSAQASADARTYRFGTRVYRRSLNARGTILSETVDTIPGVVGTPFVTVPLARLTARGYVETDGDTLVYRAPDAAALLSDAFQEEHCFRVVDAPSGERGLIGLAFEPVPGRKLTDIRGTLWLDRATAELRRMEYQYTGLRSGRVSDGAGGRLDFRRLPAGDWIVSRWRIRMPLIAAEQAPAAAMARALGSQDTVRYRLVGLREEGGEVATIAGRAGERVDVDAGALMAGVVFDSTRAAPLAGARVTLAGTTVAAETDSLGRFVLRDLPEGTYTLSYTSARADSLGYTATGVPVTLTRGATTTQNLVLPAQALAVAQAAAQARAQQRVAAATDSARALRLSTVSVVARSPHLREVGFYDRQRMGNGVFLGDSVLAANRTSRLSDLMRQVRGVRVVQYYPPPFYEGPARPDRPTAAPPPETRFVASRNNIALDTNVSPCFMTVYMDGVKIQSNTRLSQGGANEGVILASIIAIEVYPSGAQTPPRYSDGGNECGTILLWSRDRDAPTQPAPARRGTAPAAARKPR